MTALGHDAVFVEEAAALRPKLEACARVLYPDVAGVADVDPDTRQARRDTSRADRAVDQALARTYALPPDAERSVEAFRALLHPHWRPSRRATRARRSDSDRVELVDVVTGRSCALASELAELRPTSEAIVVLALLGGLGPADLARIVGEPASRVADLFGEAVTRLARSDPARADPQELTRQLVRLAGPNDPIATARAGVGDLARGRRSEHRRRIRRGLVGAAAAVAVALVGGVAVRVSGQGEVANVPSTPTPTPSQVSSPGGSYGCDLASPDCRALTLIRWRSRMSDVIVQHLDPHRRYFSDMNWGIWDSAESESFWRGQGGALAVGLSRLTDGGTEVRLQIATDTDYADRCGRQIKQRCQVFRSMDGNVYLIGGSSTRTGGVEVQFVADVDRVITVVARNSSDGKTIDIDSADLISLVRDGRLQLPLR